MDGNIVTNKDIATRYDLTANLFFGRNRKDLVLNATIVPNWIGETDRFWYLRETKTGQFYHIVDAAAGSNERAFDHAALTEQLAKAAGETLDADNLSLYELSFEPDGSSMVFTQFDQRWRFDLKKSRLSEESVNPVEWIKEPDDWEISPDGKSVVFAKDHNLYLRDLKTGEERALTQDGEEHYAYGATAEAWVGAIGYIGRGGLQAAWSPDGAYIFSVQRDVRNVKTLPILYNVPEEGVRPTVEHVKLAYPGDEHVETLRLVMINVKTGAQTPIDYPSIPALRNSFGFLTSNYGWWGKDGEKAYFIDAGRYYKYLRLVELDPKTGATRIIIEDREETHINLCLNGDMGPAYLPLPESDEILWYSERSGWAHVYLYDLKTGALKNTVTQGDWLVREIVRFDAKRREVWLQTGAREKGRNPHYRDLIRINVDTGEMHEVVSGDYDVFASAFNDMRLEFCFADQVNRRPPLMASGVSASGDYAVITRSRIDAAPESVLVDRNGNDVMALETADISGLPDDWRWPEQVCLTTADGKTEVWGAVYRPFDFDPDKSYPVLAHVFNTPDFPWTPPGSLGNDIFGGVAFYQAQALAQLGFIVVQADGRGTSFRDKAFQNHSYGDLARADDSDDMISAIKQLADRFSYMDLSRVGLVATMGGPNMQPLLKHPDFYKVAILNCLHDPRQMSASMWGDLFEGPNPSNSFPEDDVSALKTKLFLLQGMLDTTTTPASMFRIVEALQAANKDFDMLFLPKLGHQFSPYSLRRIWDYLVRHLQGVEPPKEYKFERPRITRKSVLYI